MKEIKIELSFNECTLEELDSSEQLLMQNAHEAMKNAYAPYSNFQVGAALLLENGMVITGNNQENAAYPSGLCAERVAFFSASANHPKETIKTAAVVAKHKDENHFSLVAPCGACRQVMLEYETKQNGPIRLLMQGENNTICVSENVENLLPLKFDSKALHS